MQEAPFGYFNVLMEYFENPERYFLYFESENMHILMGWRAIVGIDVNNSLACLARLWLAIKLYSGHIPELPSNGEEKKKTIKWQIKLEAAVCG